MNYDRKQKQREDIMTKWGLQQPHKGSLTFKTQSLLNHTFNHKD